VAKGRGRKGHRDWSRGGVRGLYTLYINIVNIVNIGRRRALRRWSYPFSSQLLTVCRQRNQAQVRTNGLSVYFRIFNLAMRYLAITPPPIIVALCFNGTVPANDDMVPYRSNDEGALFGSMVPTKRSEPLRCLRTLGTGRKRSSSSRGSRQQNRTNLDFACSLVSNTLCTDNNMRCKTCKNRFLLPCLRANRT
jgi:hypothetical protein